MQNKLVEQVLFDDLLWIFIFGLVELGAASMLNMKKPKRGDVESYTNLLISISCLTLAFIVVPYIYSVLLRQKTGSF
jgi:hypothetical protein